MRYRDVEIVVWPGLSTKQCIDGPSAVNVHLECLPFEQLQQIDDFVGPHSRTVYRMPAPWE